MIDIHCHLLPGLDDGAETLEEALGIAFQLQEAGFKTVIATPHVMEGRDYLTPERIIKATSEFNEILKIHKIDLKVLPGAENYLFPDMARWISKGKLLTLGNSGKYLLVEFPMLEIPHYADQVFFDLQVTGITPILAHPERNKALVEEPERLCDWAERGVLFQIDLRSLSGRYGPEAKRFAHSMTESGLVHFVGSDAHRVAQSKDAYRRELGLIKERAESYIFEAITLHNPQGVLNGDELQAGFNYDFEKFREKFSHKKQKEKSLSWVQRLVSSIVR